MKLASVFHIAIVVLLGAAYAEATPTITNSSFEADGDFGGNGYTTAITGWTSGGDLFAGFGNVPLTAVSNTSQPFASGTLIPDGTHVAALQVYSDSIFTTTLSTTITGLTAGQQYYITYDENARSGAAVVGASVTLDSSTIVAPHGVSFIGAPNVYDFVKSDIFTAGGTTAQLTFINNKPSDDTGRDASLLFDNVQIHRV